MGSVVAALLAVVLRVDPRVEPAHADESRPKYEEQAKRVVIKNARAYFRCMERELKLHPRSRCGRRVLVFDVDANGVQTNLEITRAREPAGAMSVYMPLCSPM